MTVKTFTALTITQVKSDVQTFLDNNPTITIIATNMFLSSNGDFYVYMVYS